MNKKLPIIVIITIIVILIAIIINKQNNQIKNKNNTEITQEEATKVTVEKVKEKIEAQGIKLSQGRKITLGSSQGYSYAVESLKSNNVLNSINIYMLTFQDKRNMIGLTERDGEVILKNSQETKGLLYNNILITNYGNDIIKNSIIQAME